MNSNEHLLCKYGGISNERATKRLDSTLITARGIFWVTPIGRITTDRDNTVIIGPKSTNNTYTPTVR